MFERGYTDKSDAAVPAATFMVLMEYRPRRILKWTLRQAILRMVAILREQPAGLDLTREGQVHLHQDAAFGPSRIEAVQYIQPPPPVVELPE